MPDRGVSGTQQPDSGEDYNIDDIIKKLSEFGDHISEAIRTENANGTTALSQNRTTSLPAAQTTPLSQSVNGSNQNSGLIRSESTPVPDINDNESHSIPKIGRNLHHMKLDFEKLKDFQNRIGRELNNLDNLKKCINQMKRNGNSIVSVPIKKELERISRVTFRMMCQVPMLPFVGFSSKPDDSDMQNGDLIGEGGGKEYLPGMHADDEFTTRPSFEETKEKFKNLKIERKLCLLCFSVFPQNCVLKKRMLMYWWIGEGFLSGSNHEKAADEILDEFAQKGLIEPVEEPHKEKWTSFKIPPLVHSSIVVLAKYLDFFDLYNENGKPTMKKSGMKKVGLVERSSWQPEAKVVNMEPEDIKTVFNISERFPDFTFKWFAEMKSVRVLYLGRWETTAQRHIEVESTELMKDLGCMKSLRFLSFQGISRIESISGSICKLNKLTILDLRSCHTLEKLPEKIDALENLIYLDVSECYMLDRLPKKLSLLLKLEVLKGFVVSDADEETTCTLAELKHLLKLRKLSININREKFVLDDLINALMKFEAINSLKVAWGSIPTRKLNSSGQENVPTPNLNRGFASQLRRSLTSVKYRIPKLPANLKKLDLQCFPDSSLPLWLLPENLQDLKKLYIKGGTKLTGFGKIAGVKENCSVQVLRLKFLPELAVEWRDLREKLFPKLEFLEKYHCPRVTFCPCDGYGIWRDESKKDQVTAP